MERISLYFPTGPLQEFLGVNVFVVDQSVSTNPERMQQWGTSDMATWGSEPDSESQATKNEGQ